MSAWRSASSVALAAVLALSATLAAAPGPACAQDEATSYSHRMAQGRFFLEKGLLRHALTEFEAAAEMPEGAAEVAVHHLIARTRYQLGDVGAAVEAVRRAAALQERMPPELAEFHEFLTTRFGKVLVVGARTEAAARPEPVTPLLDPELKKAFESALLRFDSGGTGSTSVYLPVGSYRVSGHIIDVKASGATRMDLRPTVGESTGGVFGERRGTGRSTPKKQPSPGTARGPSPVRHTAGSQAVSVGGALDLRVGGVGYGQQGTASGGLRGGVGAELLLGHLLGLRASVLVGAWRAERIQLLTDDPLAAGAPPALWLEGMVGASYLRTVTAGILVGPELGWGFGVSAPAATLLPSGYLGPRSYFVHGPELGVRTVFGNATMAVRPELAVKALLREHWPLGTLLVSDVPPHLSVGGALEVGARIR